MTDRVYEDVSDRQVPPVYVVGIPKLIALSVATFGIYGAYWSYRHWKEYKEHVDSSIWPIARGFFAIFHVVRLFRWLDAVTRQASYRPSWNPSLFAGMWIALVLVERLTDRFDRDGSSLILTILGLSAMLLSVVPLVVAQGVANLAAGDEDGRSNSRLTLANWGFIALGLCIWGLAAITYIYPESDDAILDDSGELELGDD